MSDEAFRIQLPSVSIEKIASLSDEAEVIGYDEHGNPQPRQRAHVLYQKADYGSTVLICSHGDTGWMIARSPWGKSIEATSDDLRRVCATLCSTGRKADRYLAGRIRSQARRFGVDTSTWAGEDAPKKPSQPRGRKAVAEAWKAGKALDGGNIRTDGKTVWSWRLPIGVTVSGRKVAIDYRGVSHSTSAHCGQVMRVADETRKPKPAR